MKDLILCHEGSLYDIMSFDLMSFTFQTEFGDIPIKDANILQKVGGEDEDGGFILLGDVLETPNGELYILINENDENFHGVTVERLRLFDERLKELDSNELGKGVIGDKLRIPMDIVDELKTLLESYNMNHIFNYVYNKESYEEKLLNLKKEKEESKKSELKNIAIVKDTNNGDVYYACNDKKNEAIDLIKVIFLGSELLEEEDYLRVTFGYDFYLEMLEFGDIVEITPTELMLIVGSKITKSMEEKSNQTHVWNILEDGSLECTEECPCRTQNYSCDSDDREESQKEQLEESVNEWNCPFGTVCDCKNQDECRLLDVVKDQNIKESDSEHYHEKDVNSQDMQIDYGRNVKEYKDYSDFLKNHNMSHPIRGEMTSYEKNNLLPKAFIEEFCDSYDSKKMQEGLSMSTLKYMIQDKFNVEINDSSKSFIEEALMNIVADGVFGRVENPYILDLIAEKYGVDFEDDFKKIEDSDLYHIFETIQATFLTVELSKDAFINAIISGSEKMRELIELKDKKSNEGKKEKIDNNPREVLKYFKEDKREDDARFANYTDFLRNCTLDTLDSEYTEFYMRVNILHRDFISILADSNYDGDMLDGYVTARKFNKHFSNRYKLSVLDDSVESIKRAVKHIFQFFNMDFKDFSYIDNTMKINYSGDYDEDFHKLSKDDFEEIRNVMNSVIDESSGLSVPTIIHAIDQGVIKMYKIANPETRAIADEIEVTTIKKKDSENTETSKEDTESNDKDDYNDEEELCVSCKKKDRLVGAYYCLACLFN